MENTSNTALLVMDMQTAILGHIPQKDALIENVSTAIAIARAKNIPVIYVVVGLRQGAPEVSARNKGFSAGAASFASIPMDEFIKIDPAITPQPGDLTVIKRRVSAFTGSDLEVILRAKNSCHLVLAGISTSGVVLSTVREAADKDYGRIVLSNGCADPNEEVHNVLMTKVFPRQADVVTVAEWGK